MTEEESEMDIRKQNDENNRHVIFPRIRQRVIVSAIRNNIFYITLQNIVINTFFSHYLYLFNNWG